MKNISTTPITRPLAEAKVATPSPSQGSSFDELYLKKDYKGAAQYLLKNKQQIDSGIFHYNLGTVYSKMGDHAIARFHLEKAIQEGYINSASLNNLTYVKSQLQVDDLTTSTSFPDELISTATSIPAAGYISMTLVLVVFFVLLIRLKKIEKKWVMIVLMILSLTPFLFSNFYVKNINYAVALQDIPLYEGPSKIFNEKGKVRAGSKIVVGQFKDGWFQVEFPISLSGWINKDQLGLY
ncbi:MAG: tetratricopeptide repeat protein [Bacteriovorax sp.]|nr:tetratricopeptide repeat protein [Bacteriovorax sp.]